MRLFTEKPPARLLEARASALSERERQVLALLAEGFSYAGLAGQLPLRSRLI